ncbi:alpha/beta hydrolase fold domain-containing protein [Streptomyces sp. NPDC058657]|uniref:alpha/beta hydrolase fold domain-containing protein n=1 Tax=unclassified Streptomyces TaxID=2593676 RepID=UPI0036693B4D
MTQPPPLPLPLRLRAPHPDRAPLPPAALVSAGPHTVVRNLRGVPYAEVEGSRPLELDLWLPAGPGPAPLVLYVHGGAWRRGRRDDMGLATRDWNPGPLARIAAAGCAVAAVDYRLSGEAHFPAPLDDLRAARRWLALRADELGIDAARTVVWGESAGGHLASLLALTHDTAHTGRALTHDTAHTGRALTHDTAPTGRALTHDTAHTGRALTHDTAPTGRALTLDTPLTSRATDPEPRSDAGPLPRPDLRREPDADPSPPPLSGAVIWYGPSDLTAAAGTSAPDDPTTPEALLLGAPPASVPESAGAASPVTHAHPHAPPFLLMHGAEDSMVPCTHSEALAAALADCGARAELHLVPDADHGWYGLADSAFRELFALSLRFTRDALDLPSR